MNKPARAAKPTPINAAAGKPKSERKPRASGDFNAELRALADKHRKKSAKLRASVTKLEGKLATQRAQLDAADEPLRKIERVLADNPELPGFSPENLSGHLPDATDASASSTHPANAVQ